MVTHDPQIAARADRRIHLRDGAVVADEMVLAAQADAGLAVQADAGLAVQADAGLAVQADAPSAQDRSGAE
jgi:putative ABC transport system ATP-binding protein